MDNPRHLNAWSRTQLNVIEIAITERATIQKAKKEREEVEDTMKSHPIDLLEHMV